MPILITGGNGLLGSWVTYYLAEKGKDIISFDLKPRSFDYLEEYQDRISFHKGDVLDWSSLVQVFQPQENKIEGIIHTPAVMASPQYWDNPYPSTILNVVGTLNLLELARLYKVPKFLYISSGAVYGETKDCPGELTHHPNPSDLYGASKAGAEFLTLQYGNHYGIDARVVRPYFFFGPGHLPSEMTPVFRTLLGSIEGLDNLYLEKGKDQRLGFTYVKDTAWGTVLAYEKENPSHRVFNIATDEVTSFPDLAKLAQKYSDEPREVVLGPGKLFPRGETLDISLAKKELGFSPRYRMEEAVAEYAEWIKKVKSTKKS
ncbi:MAG TPA: NAD(P)-dependent oxidoreductase [Candidatus Atribacteria bacterium]|nr:NAD(P)-dependent oxidoreductase [Candidatus Atribacteria bacterium]